MKSTLKRLWATTERGVLNAWRMIVTAAVVLIVCVIMINFVWSYLARNVETAYRDTIAALTPSFSVSSLIPSFDWWRSEKTDKKIIEATKTAPTRDVTPAPVIQESTCGWSFDPRNLCVYKSTFGGRDNAAK